MLEGMPPPMPHNPRNLLRGEPAPIDPAMLEGAPAEPGYAEWENIPAQQYPSMESGGQLPPLPPEVIPPDAPDWATTQQGMPEFIEYPTIRGKYTDT
jgi:hypothetical protein